jgi:hypothetical protein
MTFDAMRLAYLSGSLEPFDAVATSSSVEHSGLGRFEETRRKKEKRAQNSKLAHTKRCSCCV